MSVHRSERDTLIGDWWFQDSVGLKTQLPRPEYGLIYMKTLLNVAAADGVLSDLERDWVVGLAAVSGLPQDVIDQLKTYQPGDCKNIENLFQPSDMTFVEKSRFGIIFFGLRAASADGELHPKELEAVRILAKKLGVTDKEIDELRSLIDEEEKLRKKRAAYLFPKGLGGVMAGYDDY